MVRAAKPSNQRYDASTMVLLALSKRLNQSLGPLLLKHGIKLRHRLQGGIIRDNLYLDYLSLLPVSQKLISIEVRDAMVGIEDSQERVNILEKYVRPALVPQECWGDVRNWQFHARLLKWIRREYLWAKHGPIVKAAGTYSSIRKSAQLPGASDSLPPTTQALCSALQIENSWTNKKNREASLKPMKQIAKKLNGSILSLRGGGLNAAHIPDDASLTQMDLEDILEVAGGHIKQCSPFNALCEEANIYQFWTREYIQSLGDYLLRRSNRQTVIIDVGAGDGVLSLYLRQYLEQHEKGSIPEIVAIDDGSWKLKPKAPVLDIAVQDALDRYMDKDIIVLCSWMPMEVDWTNLFRQAKVKEYILIGEADDGQCGDNQLTWGNSAYLEDVEDRIDSNAGGKKQKSYTPLYIEDGYIRKDLEFLAPYQWSRFDCSSSKFGRTVSFRLQQ